MKKKDIIIIAAALVLALGLYLLSQIAGGETATTVVVTVDGKEVLRRPLAVENTYEIKQEDGSVNVIAVEGGAVYMKEANCRDGLCIAQGKMKTPPRPSSACRISWSFSSKAIRRRTNRTSWMSSSSNAKEQRG